MSGDRGPVSAFSTRIENGEKRAYKRVTARNKDPPRRVGVASIPQKDATP
jgi:hypothetical protein